MNRNSKDCPNGLSNRQKNWPQKPADKTLISSTLPAPVSYPSSLMPTTENSEKSSSWLIPPDVITTTSTIIKTSSNKHFSSDKRKLNSSALTHLPTISLITPWHTTLRPLTLSCSQYGNRLSKKLRKRLLNYNSCCRKTIPENNSNLGIGGIMPRN